jgi:hypothetical protein
MRNPVVLNERRIMGFPAVRTDCPVKRLLRFVVSVNIPVNLISALRAKLIIAKFVKLFIA